jgi:hypothetical protein
MSRSNYSYKTFTYDPISFGYPHNIAEPQLTEPFWHQYPEWANSQQQVGDTSLYYQPIPYPLFNPAAMEHENEPATTYIGRNTVNGRIIKKVTSPQQGKRTLAKSKGNFKVEVSSNGTFIQQMPIKVLTRFSKVAAAAFPRPELSDKPVNGEINGVGGDDKNGPTNWADDEGKDVDVEKLTADIAKLNTDSAPKVNGGAAQSSKKKLNLNLDTLYLQPPVKAFIFAFDWMHEVKKTAYGEPPLDYGGKHPEQFTLEELVEIYTAALVLDIRPNCHKLRSALLSSITEQRPTLATLMYVHEHLPIDDVAMTRFITSYFEHREKREYTPTETAEIEDYVCTEDVELYERFKDIGNAREARAKVRRRRIAEARMQRITEGNQNGAVKADGIEFVDAETEEGRQGGKWPHRGGKKQQNGEKMAKGPKGVKYARGN